MNTLRKLQHEFLGYLLDDSVQDIVERIKSTPGRSAEQRMAYYGNAYTLRLQEALSTDYDRLYSYLGDDLFATLMGEYIERYPSHHPSLRYFSQHMIELVKELEPFKSLPEVAEIALIEQAFANSFDAVDGQSVILEQLAQLDPDAWATLTLGFHDAVQLLPQKYNSFQIWRALADEEMPPEKTNDDTTWLIWREDLISRYRALDASELAALTVAMQAGNFGEVCESLLDYFGEEETPLKAVGYLQQWINDQMVCELN